MRHLNEVLRFFEAYPDRMHLNVMLKQTSNKNSFHQKLRDLYVLTFTPSEVKMYFSSPNQWDKERLLLPFINLKVLSTPQSRREIASLFLYPHARGWTKALETLIELGASEPDIYFAVSPLFLYDLSGIWRKELNLLIGRIFCEKVAKFLHARLSACKELWKLEIILLERKFPEVSWPKPLRPDEF